MAKYRLQKAWSKFHPTIPLYYVDLIRYRELSNEIAASLNIQHESPQLILLQGKTVLHVSSHNSIDAKELLNYI
jgi:bacillithiol system protein YtxJ